jgi:hypothetical protein
MHFKIRVGRLVVELRLLIKKLTGFGQYNLFHNAGRNKSVILPK